MKNGRKILIFGGAGFIGSWLVDTLKSKHKVAVFDIQKKFSNYDTERSKAVFSFRNNHLLKGARIYKGDARNLEKVRSVIEKEKPDIIVGLASIPIENYHDPILQFEIEVLSMRNILEANKDLKAKVVFMSSLFAVGPFDHVLTEEASLEPITNYGIGKATGELLVKNFAEKYSIIRTTSVYGFGDLNFRAHQIALESALIGNKFWINKAALLDFIYVGDLVEGIKRVMFYDHNDIFNISGGKAVTLFEFVRALECNLNKKLDYEVKSLQDRTKRGTLANDKARFILDWEPKYDLIGGTKEMINLYKKHMPKI